MRKSVAVRKAERGRVPRSPEARRGIDLTTRWLQVLGGRCPITVPAAIRTRAGCAAWPDSGGILSPAARKMLVVRTRMRNAVHAIVRLRIVWGPRRDRDLWDRPKIRRRPSRRVRGAKRNAPVARLCDWCVARTLQKTGRSRIILRTPHHINSGELDQGPFLWSPRPPSISSSPDPSPEDRRINFLL